MGINNDKVESEWPEQPPPEPPLHQVPSPEDLSPYLPSIPLYGAPLGCQFGGPVLTSGEAALTMRALHLPVDLRGSSPKTQPA